MHLKDVVEPGFSNVIKDCKKRMRKQLLLSIPTEPYQGRAGCNCGCHWLDAEGLGWGRVLA